VRRVFGMRVEVVSVERLAPGQWMSLRAISPPTRKERKVAKAARRSS
jgi:hypothetical protein